MDHNKKAFKTLYHHYASLATISATKCLKIILWHLHKLSYVHTKMALEAPFSILLCSCLRKPLKSLSIDLSNIVYMQSI